MWSFPAEEISKDTFGEFYKQLLGHCQILFDLFLALSPSLIFMQ